MEGAGNAGCLQHPQPRAQRVGSTRVSHHRYPGTPGIPCAMVLTAYSVLSRRRIRLVTVVGELTVSARPVGLAKTSADLTPATGARTTRLCGTQMRRSSRALPSLTRFISPCDYNRALDAAASIASRPNVRDDGQRPSLGTEWLKLVEVICPTGQAKYFLREGWTQTLQNCSSGKSVLFCADPASRGAQLNWRRLTDVPYAPIASKFRIAAK